ncbi:InlB B-repeat-containing protein, partial [Hungatella hathewayi]|uniref:InlB B-repeat-containing protein n=1 Tax=Hungatella hathewayi TaxID=154046 RepID=UPI0032C0AD4C
MKGLKKKFRRGLAGFLSFVLTMTSFNMVSWADVASAFEKENATFVMSGEDLRDSAQAAIDNGDEFNFEDLGVDTSDRSLAKEYQRLFETGSVFEFAPAYDMDEEEYADGAELRMFIRINGDPEGYQITGDEDIIFLYINDSSARVTFRSRIDGYTTQKVTVKGNSTLLEAAGPTVPSDGAGAAGGAGAGTNGAAGGEVQNPDENAGGENGTVEGNVQNPESDAADGSVQNPDANAGEGNGTTDGTVENPDAGVNDGTDNGTTGSDIQNPAGNADEGNGTAGETTGNPEINGNNGSGTAGSDIQNPDANVDSDKNANTGKDEQIQNPADHSGSSDNGQNSENGKTEEGQKSEAGADKQSSNDDKGGSNASSDEGNAGSGASDSGSSDSGSSDSGASSSGDAVVSAASVIRNYTHILTTSVNNEAGSDEKASSDERNEEKEVVSADSGDSKEKADAGEKKDAEEVKADTEDSNSSDSDNKEAAAAPADDVESNTVDDGDKADAVIPADGEEQNSSDDQADGQGEITAPADNQDNAVIDDNVKDDADKNAAADSKADDTNAAGNDHGVNADGGKNDNTLAVEPEDEEEKEEVSKTGTTSGKTYGQIVLDESYYAKAYVTTLNKLHVDVSKEGYAVTYTVTPVGTAAVKGAKNVEAGKDLTFTVKPQVGYVIDSVTANGESLEAVEEDDATDSNAETGVKRFVVPEVEEEQEIVVTMAETGEHPEFNFSKTLGDVVVSLHAEEGILPAGTEAKVTEVTEKVEEAVKEKTAEETGEDTSANTVLAYDIKLFVENEAGELEALDNSWSENGYVEVTFAGKAIEEKSAEAESLEIVHVDTGSIDVTQRSIKVVAADQVQGVETVSEAVDISGDKSVSDISFDASHFSIYAIIAAKKVYKEVTINKGETITLHSELGFGTWKSSNSGVAKINGSNNGNSVSISGVSNGEATIKRGSQETFKVIVTNDTTAYFYIWRPDSSIDQKYTVTWEYSNTGTVINLPNPYYVAGNTKFDVSNIKLFPKSYPVITKAGKSYVYDEDGGEGTYTVNWSYIIRSDGYNIGNNAYDIGPCYHVDGYAVLVEETNCTVSFDVQEVGDENFRPVESYPIIIKKNTNIKDLNVPVVADKTVDGDQYKFDGWYKDKECTVKASFTEGRITENTTFYGRYVQVLKPGQLAYDANGGIGVMTPTKGSVNKNVTVASNTFTRAGYSFSGWNTEREGTGTYYAPGSQYKLLAGDNILYAQWTPDKNTKYSVAYYYQNSDNGKFVEDTKLRDDTRTGVTGTLVEIAEDDKVAEKAGYILDNSQIKNWQGTISGDGKLVLKVYFKLQYTIAIAGDDHVNITSDSPIYVDWGSNATGSWTIDEGYSISEVTVNHVPVKVASDATSYTMSNIKENIDVYVKTKSEDANYKIEYYQENLPGAEAQYTKVKEGSGKGKTGERVQINAENFDGFEYQKDKDEYFVGKTPQLQSSPIIAGDGSLVIKLYYDRKTNLSVEVKYVEYVSDDADYSTAEELIKSEKLTGTFGTVYDIPEKSIQDYDLKLIIDRNNPKVFNENMDTIYVTYTKRAAYTVWFNGIQITDLINDQNRNNYQTSDDEWITKLSWNGMASNNTSVPYSENEIKDLADQMLKIYSDNTGWDNLSYKSFDIVQEIDLPNGKKDWETLYTSGGHESLKNVKLRAGYETRYQIYFDSTMSIKATGANRIYNGELQNLIESLTTQIDGSGAEITPTYTYEIAKITNNVIGNYKASKNPTEIEAGEYSIRIKAKKDKFKDTETVIRAVISKRPITVYAGSLTEKYDGSEKEVTKFTYTVSNEDNTAGALEDHKVSAVLENNKRTEAGDQVVRVVENSVRILSGETNVTGNYVVSLETGLLIISKRDDLKITVDAESLSHVYDGAGHGIKAAEASDTKGTTIEYSTNGRTWSGTIPQFTEYKEGGYPVYVRAKNLNYS